MSHDKRGKFTVIDGGGTPNQDHPHPDPKAVAGRSKKRRESSLPFNLPPRWLRREQVADYLEVSANIFDRMVKDRLMPPPHRVYGCVRWSLREIDAACDALDTEGASSDIQSRMAL